MSAKPECLDFEKSLLVDEKTVLVSGFRSNTHRIFGREHLDTFCFSSARWASSGGWACSRRARPSAGSAGSPRQSSSRRTSRWSHRWRRWRDSLAADLPKTQRITKLFHDFAILSSDDKQTLRNSIDWMVATLIVGRRETTTSSFLILSSFCRQNHDSNQICWQGCGRAAFFSRLCDTIDELWACGWARPRANLAVVFIFITLFSFSFSNKSRFSFSRRDFRRDAKRILGKKFFSFRSDHWTRESATTTSTLPPSIPVDHSILSSDFSAKVLLPFRRFLWIFVSQTT